MEEVELGAAAMAAANAGAAAAATETTQNPKPNAINWNTFTGSLFSNLGSIIDSTSNLASGILANQTAAQGGTPPPIIVAGNQTPVQPTVATPNAAVMPQVNYIPQSGTKSAQQNNILMYVGIGVAIFFAIGLTVLLTRK